MDLSSVFRLTDLINKLLSILNAKFADPARILSSSTTVLSCYNIFKWSIQPINRAEELELIINFLNQCDCIASYKINWKYKK